MRLTLMILLLIYSTKIYSQPNKSINLEGILSQYYLQSDEAIKAGITTKQKEIEWKNFSLSKLPTIAFNINPINFTQSIVPLQDPNTGNYNFIQNYVNNSNIGMNIAIPINFTGGSIYLSSNLNYMREFSLNKNSFNAGIFNIGYSQPLLGGRRNYILEKNINILKKSNIDNENKLKHYQIQKQCVSLYLQLLVSDIKLSNLKQNIKYTDKIFLISKDRFRSGEITELDVIQAEIQFNEQKLLFKDAENNRDQALRALLTFLNIEYNYYEVKIPEFKEERYIDTDIALSKFKSNNPFFYNKKIRLAELEKNLYAVKLKNGFNSSLNMSYGLNQYGTMLYQAYSNPSSNRGISIGVTIPVINWGRSKNNIKISSLQKEAIEIDINNEEIKMIENLRSSIQDYNYSINLLDIAEKQYILSERQCNLMMQNFKLGQNNYFELKTAIDQMQQSQTRYLNKLSEVWNRYYDIRTLTLQ